MGFESPVEKAEMVSSLAEEAQMALDLERRVTTQRAGARGESELERKQSTQENDSTRPLFELTRAESTGSTQRHDTPPTLPVPCWSSSTLCMRSDDASFASCWR